MLALACYLSIKSTGEKGRGVPISNAETPVQTLSQGIRQRLLLNTLHILLWSPSLCAWHVYPKLRCMHQARIYYTQTMPPRKKNPLKEKSTPTLKKKVSFNPACVQKLNDFQIQHLHRIWLVSFLSVQQCATLLLTMKNPENKIQYLLK